MHPAIRRFARRHFHWPSALFLLAVLINTSLIALASDTWLAALLVVPQALLMVGCQETKHLAVHRTFFANRALNDIAGMACAALFGVNFFAYRYFHLAHHRHTCTQDDPEGRLYALSWHTRWIWMLAPIELPWVAWHLNRIGWTMVPAAKRAQRNAALLWMIAFAALLAMSARYAPRTLILAYLLPLALFAWIDFVLTQSEHYGVAIDTGSRRRDVGLLTHDVVLPFGLGWLTLHRALHRVHHRDPALPWFQAPSRLEADATAPAPHPYGAFVRRWLREGPRLWQTENGVRADARAWPESGR
ncbi:MAG TPA: fatty acid desaturase [Trinickia sp.]|uniref:fatty acid desaturase family protein n=1 Tax=Trinickia sp. TaxID=2571163 RepID=UPI002C9DCE44|nr:fatty acid desaturase [Trinickia sp.]HVW48882.1 fatty acid desaturase [Trinickia sp.]